MSAQQGYGQSAQAPPLAAPSTGQLPVFQLPLPEVQNAFNNFLQTIGLYTYLQPLMNNVGPVMGNGIGALTGGLPTLLGTTVASPSPNANANPNYKK